MMEQQWCDCLYLVQPSDGSPLAAVKGLVLSSGPTFNRSIGVLKDAEHGGPVERAIVLPSPLYHRVVQPSHVGQRHVGLAIESPAAHCLPHPPKGIVTGVPVTFGTFGCSRSFTITGRSSGAAYEWLLPLTAIYATVGRTSSSV